MSIICKALDKEEARHHRDALAAIMVDCVTAGASIGFLSPFTLEQSKAWWDTVISAISSGQTALIVAVMDGEVVGTAQLGLDGPCNGRHRADVKKVMVAPRFHGRGIGKALMHAVEAEAKAQNRIVMVLDTVTHSTAFHLYKALGWVEVGPIPDYARFPDGSLCSTTYFYKRVP